MLFRSPHYVIGIDAAAGDVVLAPRDRLDRPLALVEGVRWLVPEPAAGDGIAAEVKIRARSQAAPARIVPDGRGAARIEFASPVTAITPGQAAVFYRGDLVLGGGWIAG